MHPSSLGELERKNSSEMRAVLRMAMEKAFSQVNVESQVRTKVLYILQGSGNLRFGAIFQASLVIFGSILQKHFLLS